MHSELVFHLAKSISALIHTYIPKETTNVQHTYPFSVFFFLFNFSLENVHFCNVQFIRIYIQINSLTYECVRTVHT